MVDLRTLQFEIFDFLRRNDHEVMAIEGDGGVGKTHAWKKNIKKYKSEIHANFKKYSYVSLSKVESINQLKHDIYKNSIPNKSIGEEKPLVRKLIENTPSILQGVAAGFGFERLAKQIMDFLAAGSIIICLDDFEETTLDIESFLKFIAELRNDKNCKVILIFDERKLLKKLTEEQYADIKLNTIDTKTKLVPTPQECADICFNVQDRSPTVDEIILKERCEKLEIRNIGIIQKFIKNNWGRIYDIAKNSAIIEEVISSLVLLTHSHHASNISDEVPNIKFIKNYNPAVNSTLAVMDSNNKETKWNDILLSYTLPNKLIAKEKYFNSLYEIIFDVVENGIVDGTKLREELKKREIEHLRHILKTDPKT